MIKLNKRKTLENELKSFGRALIIPAGIITMLLAVNEGENYNKKIVSTRPVQNQKYQGYRFDDVHGDTILVFDPDPITSRVSDEYTLEARGNPLELGINTSKMGKPYNLTLGIPRSKLLGEQVLEATPVANYENSD